MDDRDHDTQDMTTDPTPTASGDYRVVQTGVFGWTICQGPNLDFARTSDGGFAINYPTAEDAQAAIKDSTSSDDDTDGM